ncbi:MAG TPA: plasmid pRiA4b ORF-3 family protein [Clostridiales bacterium]|nr:plasmid pRiA4b ORF-3 family protein [Clostridiales bacterium]
MGKQSKGKCRFCGKEYTKASMMKHVSSCLECIKELEQNENEKTCGYFGLVITGKHDKSYWLITEFREDATLKDVDQFLRDIWLECCGHLSSFEILGITYDRDPDPFDDWGHPVKSMNCKLKSVIKKGMTFEYEYDFGSSTDLVISVFGYRGGKWKKDRFTILSRNNPISYICDECGEKPATAVCAQCIYEGMGMLCDDCQKDHECGEELLLPVCNSPRVGVCGYEGSLKYPD